MKDKLTARRVALVPTLRCTLKCKLCCNFMPQFQETVDVPIETLTRDLDHIFELFDRVQWVQFVGGEIFLRRDLAAVYDYLLKYRQQFEQLILMTNATILPDQEAINALRQYGAQCQIMISDYGRYSNKVQDIIKICQDYALTCVVKNYHGDMQYYGGWIDNTQFIQFAGDKRELAQKVRACPQVTMQNMHCLNGRLHLCSNSLFLSELGVSQPQQGDFVDLNDEQQSLQEKRSIIRNFYSQPAAACQICAFKDAQHLPRYPAAEQIERR